ncbi:MAG: hypothetical protein ABFS09_03735 [Thermodesulfobacteriota bacterium]
MDDKTPNSQPLPPIWQRAVDNWQSESVARKKVGVFSGGAMEPRTMANLDCDQEVETPTKYVFNGRTVFYDKYELAHFLAARTVVVKARYKEMRPPLRDQLDKSRGKSKRRIRE